MRIVADDDEAGIPVGWEAQNWRVTRAASGGGWRAYHSEGKLKVLPELRT